MFYLDFSNPKKNIYTWDSDQNDSVKMFAEGKLTIKYRPDSENFTKQVRLFDPPISYESTYTKSTETYCNDEICNKVIYSGTRFVEEDNQWSDNLANIEM